MSNPSKPRECKGCAICHQGCRCALCHRPKCLGYYVADIYLEDGRVVSRMLSEVVGMNGYQKQKARTRTYKLRRWLGEYNVKVRGVMVDGGNKLEDKQL